MKTFALHLQGAALDQRDAHVQSGVVLEKLGGVRGENVPHGGHAQPHAREVAVPHLLHCHNHRQEERGEETKQVKKWRRVVREVEDKSNL